MVETPDDFRLLVESVRDYAIFMLDPDGRIASWNPGAERIKGWHADEIIGQHFARFYPPEDVAAGKPDEELRVARRDGRLEDEGWRVRKDGSRFWANVVITALFAPGGELRGFAKVTRDLSERRKAEEALRANAASLSATLMSIGDGVISTDAEGRVTVMNRVAEELTGWRLAEARERPLAEVFHIVNEETRRLVDNPVERVLREGVIVGLANHTVLVSRDGSERAIADSGAPIRDIAGRLIGAVIVFRDVSSERAVEENLRRSEERFRLLADGVTDYALIVLDPDGKVASWNRAAERILGYSAPEVLGQSVARFYPEEDVRGGKPARALETAAREGRYEEEGWRVGKDGRRFLASVVVSAVRGPDGGLRGFAKVTRDISERRAATENERRLFAETALRVAAERSERWAAQILANLTEGVTVQDLSGRVVYANDAAAQSMGLASGGEVTETDLSELVGRFRIADEKGDPVPQATLPGRRALGGEDPPPTLLQIEDKVSGRRWWSMLRARAIRDESGRPIQVVNVWHDASEERRATEVARLLAEASSILAAGLDDESTLERVADLAVPPFGDWAAIDLVEQGVWRRAAVAGRADGRILLDADSGIPAVARTGRPRRVGGTLMVPLLARNLTQGVLTLRFVERRRDHDAEEQAVVEELGRRIGIAVDNARLYREAQEAVRARDDFLLIAGHELRTPLAALALQVSSLPGLVKRGDLKTLGERADKMARQCLRMERLIGELLDVSRITAGQLELQVERIDLAATTSEVLERLTEQVVAAGCRVDLAAEPAFGRWDRERIEQVVSNLISNALKYGRGGQVEVKVAARDGKAFLSVRDHGMGIKPADQARIFERFERAVSSRNYGGLGLGLWISRQIIEQHGGAISVASIPEEGATFTVELPGG